MPVDQIVSQGLFPDQASYVDGGSVVEYYQFDPTAVPPLLGGNAVALMPLTAPGPPVIRTNAPSRNAYMIGVATNAPAGGWGVGAIVPVVTKGIVLALFSQTTVAGQYGITSPGINGVLVPSASVTAGLTLGVILQSVTISSGTALVPFYVNRM